MSSQNQPEVDASVNPEEIESIAQNPNNLINDLNNKLNLYRTILILVLLFLVLSFSFSGFKNTAIGNSLNSVVNPSTFSFKNTDYETQRKQITDILQTRYIGDLPDQNKIDQGQLIGLVQSVGDRYTSYFSCSDYQKFQDDLNQNFEGIGARFTQIEDYIAVADLIPNSPAQKAGVQKDDILVAVDDQLVDDITFSKIIEKIRGKAGTTVKLTLDRPDQNSSLTKKTYTKVELNIQRQQIHEDAVVLVDKGEIAWIKVSTFSGEVDAQMNLITSQIKQNPKFKYVVLDLRDNGGGLLNQSIALASYFLPPNTTVVREKAKNATTEQKTEAKVNNLMDYPLIVAVNQDSASASEITAGALQDNKKAKILGKKTYGKGVVQEINNLTGCDKLKVTVAQWLTPNSREINNVGISPDIRINRGEDYEQKVKDLIQNNQF